MRVATSGGKWRRRKGFRWEVFGAAGTIKVGIFRNGQ